MNLSKNPTDCPCGREHLCSLQDIIIGSGAIQKLPRKLKDLNIKRPFLLTDINIDAACGNQIREVLSSHGISFGEYIFLEKHLHPDETAVGSAVMHFDASCDGIIALGSGVINDIAKIVSHISGKPFLIVATAPSMDGYASSSSSMAMDGVKVTLYNNCPNVIIGDTDILKNAPIHLLKAGLGDMLAKYVSICEWQISHIVNGEYYCDTIAQMMRDALKQCVEHAKNFLAREPEAVETVFRALVFSGIAMSYAQVSRPASGIEHYFSHVWDMRGLEFGTNTDLHGIQCGVGTVYALKLYEALTTMEPDRQKATEHAKAFDYASWSKTLKAFMGKSADAMIAIEKTEQNFSFAAQQKRFDAIEKNWQEILAVAKKELPKSESILALLTELDMPATCEDIGLDKKDLPMIFRVIKDMRLKYIIAHMAWDMGITEELIEKVFS